ncbi:Transcriptional regulator, contains XRE-family HTH domain [Ruminococcus albus]|uniref:Transcriptional regulator, contains XRE-family HTH domain n=2 Tax=Ruminococcus albus TaxID=1264 RepID=A0A1I1IS20_RUMAL|nr:Transcriptional regulator, contains XRE-family HTH domain [Ruminococcus albus]
MDQVKIGAFLKQIRNEKGLSQEKLAEVFGVSSRSVSRWENGRTMPDISIMIELADYYGIDIREVLDGERKSENMNEDMKETMTMVADYTDKQKKQAILRGMILFGLEMLCCGYTVAILIMMGCGLKLPVWLITVPLLLTAVFAFMVVLNAKEHVRRIQRDNFKNG